MKQNVVAVIVLFAGIGLATWASLDTKRSDPKVTNARATIIPDSRSAMVTFDILNEGGPDRLIEATSDSAKLTVLKSPRAKGLPIPAASQASLSGEGGHIMMMGIQGDLTEGALLPLSVQFENAGTVATKAVAQHSMMNHGQGLDVPADQPIPSIALTVVPEGDRWHVSVTVSSFRFAQELVDGPHVPGTGHAHLYIEGTKLGRLYQPEAWINALPTGQHTVEVALFSNDHRALQANGKPIAAEQKITVP